MNLLNEMKSATGPMEYMGAYALKVDVLNRGGLADTRGCNISYDASWISMEKFVTFIRKQT